MVETSSGGTAGRTRARRARVRPPRGDRRGARPLRTAGGRRRRPWTRSARPPTCLIRDRVSPVHVEAGIAQGTPRHVDRRRRRTVAVPDRRRSLRSSPSRIAPAARRVHGVTSTINAADHRRLPRARRAAAPTRPRRNCWSMTTARDVGKGRIGRWLSRAGVCGGDPRAGPRRTSIHPVMSPDVYRLFVVDPGGSRALTASGSPTRWCSNSSEPAVASQSSAHPGVYPQWCAPGSAERHPFARGPDGGALGPQHHAKPRSRHGHAAAVGGRHGHHGRHRRKRRARRIPASDGTHRRPRRATSSSRW